MRRQLTALSKQVPLLYGILSVNSIAIAYTHVTLAPAGLAVGVPAALLPICLVRGLAWTRLKPAEVPTEKLAPTLHHTLVLTCLLGVAFVAWSLLLAPYGDAYAKTHVAYFISITCIGCIFCLMHLRPAALLLTLIVTVPFAWRFLSMGNPVLTAIVLNFGCVAGIMVVMLLNYSRDFQDLVRSQEHLAVLSRDNHRLANIDPLTGLANRRSFFADLAVAIETATREGTSFVLGLIDLDGFKPINDVHGHRTGDALLVEIGRRLDEMLGPSVKIARLGGDEFGLILAGAVDSEQIRRQGAAVCDAIQVPFLHQSGSVQVGASIGFAAFPAMGRTREQLIERADYALYHAKEHHRGTAIVFTEDHEKAIRASSLIAQELRRADLSVELSLQFQPLVDVTSGNTVAYEALARWDSPVLGRVPPIDFIVAAERIGLINRLTEVLLAQGCRAAAAWPDDVKLSFNLSTHDIATDEAVERVRAIILASALCPSRVILEITETAVMHDFDQAREALLSLKSIGCDIALDDFGTGYSSLSYVHRLPLDRIKVDRSFTAGLTSDQISRDIVKSIIELCSNLGIACVVEGVETLEHTRVLTALGCKTMQGYHFGRPMDLADVLRIIEAAPTPEPAPGLVHAA